MMIFNAIILKEIMKNIDKKFDDLVNLVFKHKTFGDKILSSFIKISVLFSWATIRIFSHPFNPLPLTKMYSLPILSSPTIWSIP